MNILTHNVYWFQGSPSLWGDERCEEKKEVLDALVNIYDSSKADIIFLQEVPSEDAAGLLAEKLGICFWIYARGGGRPDYGGAVFCREEAAFRDCTLKEGVALHERVHLRSCVVFQSAALEMAMVHLPSNRFFGSSDAGDNTRIKELGHVINLSPAPGLIAGDFNCVPGSAPYRFLEEQGYLDASAIVKNNAPLERIRDYIWLDRSLAKRFRAFKLLDGGDFNRVDDSGKPWNLSDHPPLLVEIF